MKFQFLFPFQVFLLSIFIIRTTSIVDILNYANMSNFSFANIRTSIVTNNGQTSYISLQNGSAFIISQYNINTVTGTLTYINRFIDPYNQVFSNRLLIYNNTYLIASSTTNLIFNVFGLSNYSFCGNYTINQYVEQFYLIASKGIILYLTTNGILGYILNSQFPSGSYKYIIDQNFSATSRLVFAVSNDENYVALASIVNTSVFVYYLTNYTLKCNYNLPSSGVGALAWMLNNQIILISSFTQGFIIKLNVTTCSGVSNIVTPNQTYKVAKMTYYSATNEAILTGLSMSTNYNYGIYSFSLDSNYVTFLKNYSSNVLWLSYNYQSDNNNYFCLSRNSSVNFMNIVSNCSVGLVYDSSTYQCVQNVTTPATNTTQPTFNTTNTTSFNATNISNITNLTNSTNAINATNTTNTSLNNVNNYSNFNNYTQESENSQIVNFQSFIEGSLQNKLINALNSVPGSRKVLQPFFTFFVNFDDLWLYNYHEREYNDVITSVFESVQHIQNQKWTLLQFQKIWSFIGLDSNNTIQLFNSKQNRSSRRFIEVQQNSNGFILNTLNFFCSNVFLMFIVFIIFRIMFFLLFKYRVSIIFRQYSFWLYFIMLILDGNVQYLTYLFSFQMENFFSVNFDNKFGLGLAVLLYFVVFIFAVAAFPFIKHQYGNYIRYFTQNIRVYQCQISFIYMMFHFGYRNVLLGFLHTIFDQNYALKIGFLALTEIIFLLFIIFLLKKNIFINHLKVWVNIIATFLRIILIFTFYLDENNIQTQVQYVHIAIFYFYISQMFIAIFIQIIRILIQTISFMKGQQSIEEYIRAIEKQSKKQSSNKAKRYKVKFIKKQISQFKENQIMEIAHNEFDERMFLQNIEVNKYKPKDLKISFQNEINSKNTPKLRFIKNKHTRAPVIKKNMKIFQYVPGMTLETQVNISEIDIK